MGYSGTMPPKPNLNSKHLVWTATPNCI